MKNNPHRVGLALGFSFAIYHFIWILLTIFGLGKVVAGQYAAMHFMRFDIEFIDFNFTMGVVGLLSIFIVGYGMGCIFGFVWDRLIK